MGKPYRHQERDKVEDPDDKPERDDDVGREDACREADDGYQDGLIPLLFGRSQVYRDNVSAPPALVR